MSKDKALKLALEALEVANSCVDGYYIPKGKTHLPEVEEAIIAIKEALAQPQRTWVGLTDEERSNIYNQTDWNINYGWEYEQAIEAKLRSKNT